MTKTDPNLQRVATALQSGDLPPEKELEAFKRCADELSQVKGVILRGYRIVPPEALRTKILKLAHEGHPGIVQMKSRLRQSVWWPGIDTAAEKLCNSCMSCKIVAPANPPELMWWHQIPTEAWQELATDLIGPMPSGEMVLVVVDYFSRYPEIAILKDTRA